MVTIMNITELHRALHTIGISDRVLAIGGRAEYSWCVEPSADGMWEVFWYERGNKNDLVRLPTESDACYQLLGRLAYTQLLSGTLVARKYRYAPAPSLSPDLIEFARIVGYAVTPNDHSGAACLWTDPGGKIRFYVRQRFDSHSIITRGERGSDEHFELGSPTLDAVEHHLLTLCGSDSRSRKRVPRLRLPRDLNDIAKGFRISDEDPDGFCTLIDADDHVIAFDYGGIVGTSKLVTLSHLVSHPLADIIASYEDPEGRPLFAG